MTAAERAKADAARYTPRFTTEAPRRMVRPELPNNYDATMGGKATIPQYEANNRKMYSLAPVPTAGSPDDLQRIASRYGNGVVTPATNPKLGAPAPAAIAGRYSFPAPSSDVVDPQYTAPADAASTAQMQQPSWFQGALADASGRARGMGAAPENNAPSRWAVSGRGSQTPSTIRYYQNKDIRDKRMNPQRSRREEDWSPY